MDLPSDSPSEVSSMESSASSIVIPDPNTSSVACSGVSKLSSPLASSMMHSTVLQSSTKSVPGERCCLWAFVLNTMVSLLGTDLGCSAPVTDSPEGSLVVVNGEVLDPCLSETAGWADPEEVEKQFLGSSRRGVNLFCCQKTESAPVGSRWVEYVASSLRALGCRSLPGLNSTSSFCSSLGLLHRVVGSYCIGSSLFCVRKQETDSKCQTPIPKLCLRGEQAVTLCDSLLNGICSL